MKLQKKNLDKLKTEIQEFKTGLINLDKKIKAERKEFKFLNENQEVKGHVLRNYDNSDNSNIAVPYTDGRDLTLGQLAQSTQHQFYSIEMESTFKLELSKGFYLKMDIELDLGVGEGDVEPDTRVIPLCQIRDNNSNSDITDDMGFGLNLVLGKKRYRWLYSY